MAGRGIRTNWLLLASEALMLLLRSLAKNCGRDQCQTSIDHHQSQSCAKLPQCSNESNQGANPSKILPTS